MTYEIGMMFGLLGLTEILFVSEWERIDVSALIVLVLLGWLNYVPTNDDHFGAGDFWGRQGRVRKVCVQERLVQPTKGGLT